MTVEDQRARLDAIRDLNQQRNEEIGDDEIAARIASYELAFRMQAKAPDLLDLSKESDNRPGDDTRGRDHHPAAFTMWLAGGGVKGGIAVGETDELGLGVIKDKVHVHDLHATILHLLGLNHKKLTYRHQGRDFRLTDVAGSVVEKMLS